MKNQNQHETANYLNPSHKDISDHRLLRILHIVQTENELPEDITPEEKEYLRGRFVEPYIDEDGSYSYHLTESGSDFIIDFLFRQYENKKGATEDVH